ncbi:15070_t:CDS:2 [Cetraspora pellucida]|uniref:15070_t:CDS:1 n=1 Tax=Cetraspora pellucida TaxID=1433469 RepID=A0A9N9E7D1_9GLOM|nr:15070_t:CDS:2 [Cetraspora pellucida]
MRVALTINICTSDGMVNGSQGILCEIIYDTASSIVRNINNKGENIIIFDKLPKYIIIKLLNHKPNIDGSNITHEFQRKQLPITLAFVITEFKCQKATLEKVIIDLDGGNKRAGIYVMLLQVQRIKDLMIFQPFNLLKLNAPVDSDLKKKLECLEECSKITDQLITWPNITHPL